MAMFQQMFTMLQQGPVRQRSRSLSMHSQVEPAGFNSQTTRVSYHPRLWLHANGYHSQVVANATTSIVTFSILSPDPSFSYDRIKLRLEEYRILLASDSDTIELSTENGKTIICRKQANEMEGYLDRAEVLLQDVVQSRDISTIVVLHHLRDLTEVLENLKLYDECRLTGNCVLDLAEALGRQSLEFRQEQAETLALIAGLSVYQPRARTLFVQAVAICEEVVENNASHSNRKGLLNVLHRAGYWATDHLCAQWLGRAVQLMTKELPPTMVHPYFRSVIYYNYGYGLDELRQYSNAIEAYREALSIGRTLANNDPAKYNIDVPQTLGSMGMALGSLGKYDDAIVAYKEVLEICTTMSAQDPLRYNELMANTLIGYGIALGNLNQVSEAAIVEKQAISLLRNLAQTGNEGTKLLCNALNNYGYSCGSLGQHAEAVLAYQECILLQRALAETDSEQEIDLRISLHDITISFHALDKFAEANTAANEALEGNHWRIFEDCRYAPNFRACFVCQRGIIPNSLQNASPVPQAICSSQGAQHPGDDAFLTPAETLKPTGETVSIPIRRKRDKIIGFFRGNRAQ
jgi:tetratricopeptide (TPR) repeat protein